MSYKEPGVYLELVNSRPNTVSPSSLIPVILGVGPAFMDHLKVPVTASVGLVDALPSTKATAVLGVYMTLTGAAIDATANYTFAAETGITWLAEAPVKPATGAVYYVDYEARPEAIQYQAAFIDTFDKLDTAYGAQLMKVASKGVAATVNPVYLGAYLALEAGSPGVYCVQVQPEDTTTYTVVSADYTTTLADVVSFIESAYQIVPMSQDSEVISAVISHVGASSTVEERKERCTFISKKLTAVTTNGVVTDAMASEVIAYTSALANKRVLSIFVPSTVTKTLSDGNIHLLEGNYFCAALAGLDSVIATERSLTRQKVLNFLEVKDNKMTRAVKNQIAAAGVIVLDQVGGAGSAISIRHGVTTKMDNVADREYSVVKIADYVAKFLRNNLEGYIGIFNIDDFFVTKVKGTLTAAFHALTVDHKINGNKTILVAQDADNPDTLLIVVSINPPYPCNYIDITLVIE